MKKLLLFILIIPLFFSCDNQKELYSEVMVIHDTAMAKMDKIITLKSALKEKAQAMSQDTTNTNIEEVKKINDLILNLDAADESMMNWMREFHQDYESHAKEEIMDYLENQKDRITKVGEEMNQAIEAANAYLQNSD